MKKYICFDIGGTFIKYGIIDSEGDILKTGKISTPKTVCKVTIPQIIIRITNEFKISNDISAVGISSAGQVDQKTGTILFAMDTIQDYTGCKLMESISSKTELPVFVENDANCAAFGEMWKGAGKDFKNFVCVTLGTGVGGAIILNKKLYSGVNDVAGDFGKFMVNSSILPSPSCFDYAGSTKSLLERYKKLTGENIDGFSIAEKIRSNKKEANEAYNDFLESLITGLQTIAYILAPEAIIIGGGISAEGDFFFDRVNELFREKTIGLQKNTKIVKAGLENNAGLLGAAFICQNENYIL